MTATDNRGYLKKMRRVLWNHEIKYGIYEDESGLYVFMDGISINRMVKEFKEWFKDFNVNVYKSKPEEITIEILN